MDSDDVWRSIDAHRIRVADQLGELSEDEWRQPSLCAGWTIRDVAAHVTLQQIGGLTAIGGIIRARGNLDRAIHDLAVRRAELSTEDLIGRIRDTIGSRAHNIGVTCRETLIDILVHSQDIMVPLRRPLPLDPVAASEAASRVWSTRFFRPQQRLKGFRLTATDMDWSVGEGLDVRAPMEALLLLVTGRLVVLPRLDGAGVTSLTRQLSRIGSNSP